METSEVLFQLPTNQRSRLIDLRQTAADDQQQPAVLGNGQLQVVLLQLHNETDQLPMINMPLLLIGQYSLPLSHQIRILKQGESDYILQAQLNAPDGSQTPSILLYRLETGQSAGSPTALCKSLEPLDQLFAHYCQYEMTQYRQQLAAVDERSGQIVCVFDSQSYKPVASAAAAAERNSNNHQQQIIEWTGQPVSTSTASSGNISGGTGKRLADKAVDTSARIADTMIAQAGRLGGSIRSGADSLKSRITPKQQPVRISAKVKQRMSDISAYTRLAAQITGTVVRTAISGAEAFGGYLGAALTSSKSTAPTMERFRDTRYLLAQSIVAAANLARGFDQSVRIVACEAGQATIELAGWKYGQDMREVVEQAVDSAGKVSLVYFDSRGLSRRAIVRIADGAIRPVAVSDEAITVDDNNDDDNNNVVVKKIQS